VAAWQHRELLAAELLLLLLLQSTANLSLSSHWLQLQQQPKVVAGQHRQLHAAELLSSSVLLLLLQCEAQLSLSSNRLHPQQQPEVVARQHRELLAAAIPEPVLVGDAGQRLRADNLDAAEAPVTQLAQDPASKSKP
jgi:hypothetical protein